MQKMFIISAGELLQMSVKKKSEKKSKYTEHTNKQLHLASK